ncbi:MAG: caspase family protein, partial [Spirochaeta sp.]|nr:caspase family protein [Spirochaeta sp.]
MISKNPPQSSLLVKIALLALIISAIGPLALAAEGNRVALVIGNGDYQTRTVAPLRNPPNDAQDVSRALQNTGFEVRTVIDGTREEMGIAIEQFGRDLRGADVGLFYFAGHGVQVDGTNYLIPVDANLPDATVVRFRTVAADEVLAYMESAGSRVNLFFLDACRDNPLPQVSRTLTRGLAPVTRRPPETMIVYATGANDTADDGQGRNSPFTEAFLNHVGTPGLDVYDLYRNVSREVQVTTDGKQRPEQFGNVTERFSFVPASPDVATTAPVRPGFQVERAFGSIRVTVETAGTVYLDGERIGELGAGQSATLSDVETGSRRLEVRYADGEGETSTVTVRSGTAATARFSYVERSEPEGYQTGDRGPAGGIVFYDKGRESDGWRYLEAAPEDLAGGDRVNWDNAMSAAGSFRSGGYSDWRLPTKDELNLMYDNLHRQGVGGFASSYYWSSSGSYSSNAWGQNFRNGYQDGSQIKTYTVNTGLTA